MKRSAIAGSMTMFSHQSPSQPSPPLAQQRADLRPTITIVSGPGWNYNETTLTPTNVGPTSFGVLFQIGLDDQVDAQPLVVSKTNRLSPVSRRELIKVVYVATESNTIYAINAAKWRPCCLAEILELRFPCRFNGCPSGAGPNVGDRRYLSVIDVTGNQTSHMSSPIRLMKRDYQPISFCPQSEGFDQPNSAWSPRLPRRTRF